MKLTVLGKLGPAWNSREVYESMRQGIANAIDRTKSLLREIMKITEYQVTRTMYFVCRDEKKAIPTSTII